MIQFDILFDEFLKVNKISKRGKRNKEYVETLKKMFCDCQKCQEARKEKPIIVCSHPQK